MKMKVETIKMDIDIYKFSIIPCYKQTDIDKSLEIIITKNNKNIDLSEYNATVYFELPSKKVLNYPCDIIENKVEVILTEEVLFNRGRVYFEIVLKNSTQKVTTFTACLEVKNGKRW
jgi:hypothetical protein